MKPNEASQGKLISLNEIISPDSQAQVNEVSYNNVTSTRYSNNRTTNQEDNKRQSYVRGQTNVTNTSPQVKITRKVVTTQPVTQTTTTRKVVTTTTIKGDEPKQNTRYNNTNTLQNIITSTKTTGTSSARPGTQTTSNYGRTGTQNNNINITRVNNTNTTNNPNYRNYQKPEQPQRIQNSQSYSGNRNQPKRVEVSSSHYKPKAKSPTTGSIKRKTINRGKPVENIQITHIIFSSRPLDFHITEELNLDNLSTQPIQISEEDRNNLQKSGKVEVSYCCNEKPNDKPVNLDGTLIHYQHAQGIGMTDDKSKNLNKKFYQSEIKTLEPYAFNKGEPIVEYLEFRSAGKNYNSNPNPKVAPKTIVKPTTTYNINQANKSYTQNRTYTNTNQLKNTGTSNSNRGGISNTTRTTNTTSNPSFRGSTGKGTIVKETTTKVQMGSRSQYHNQGKPVVSTTTERKVYNQNNFFKK